MDHGEFLILETELLQSIAQSLAQIAQASSPASQQTLGFGDAPKSQMYVFCNRKHGGIWYHLDDQSQPVPINDTALTGYVKDLKFEKVDRRGKEVSKMHLIIEADRSYKLESAHDSNFSKGLMSAFATLTQEQLLKPITICPKASDQSEEVLFGNVYQDGVQVFAPYDEQTDWKKVCRTAMYNISAANGTLPTSAAQ